MSNSWLTSSQPDFVRALGWRKTVRNRQGKILCTELFKSRQLLVNSSPTPHPMGSWRGLPCNSPLATLLKFQRVNLPRGSPGKFASRGPQRPLRGSLRGFCGALRGSAGVRGIFRGFSGLWWPYACDLWNCWRHLTSEEPSDSLSGTRRVIRNAIRAKRFARIPIIIARQAGSPDSESLEFPICANHPIRASRAN